MKFSLFKIMSGQEVTMAEQICFITSFPFFHSLTSLSSPTFCSFSFLSLIFSSLLIFPFSHCSLFCPVYVSSLPLSPFPLSYYFLPLLLAKSLFLFCFLFLYFHFHFDSFCTLPHFVLPFCFFSSHVH